MHSVSKRKSLSDLIRKRITHKIFLCIMLLIFFLISFTGYDIFIIVDSMSKNLEQASQQLADFVISQSLINNENGINVTIKSMQPIEGSKVNWIKDERAVNNKFMWFFPFSWEYNRSIKALDGRDFGTIIITGNFLDNAIFVREVVLRFISLFIVITTLFIFLLPLSKRIPNDLFVKPIKNLLELLKSKNTTDVNFDKKSVSLEVKELVEIIIELVKNEKKKSEVEAISLLSEQVLHDIKSPLSVLEMTLSDVKDCLPNHEYATLSEVTMRVRDITNNLFSRYRESVHSIDNNSDTIDSINSELQKENGGLNRYIILTSIIETIVSQKRQEWKKNPCSVTVNISNEATFLWIFASPNDLKTIISNLLNNAYEALINNREIFIRVFIENHFLCVAIEDHGVGIPDDKLNLVKSGVSLKHKGTGIGLSTALNYMNNIGGTLQLYSKVSAGTVVTLSFPIADKPLWFSEKILINNNSLVVVLDDDSSIHALLKRKFLESDIESIHFDLVPDFFKHSFDDKSYSDLIFLIDYDLHNSEKNGVDIISQLNSKSQIYLMTSHYDKYFIQEACSNMKCFLLPKIFLNNISIKYNNRSF